MNDPKPSDLPSKGQFLVYLAEDGRTKIEVRLENETVWLSQQHMADLFQTTKQNVSLQGLRAKGASTHQPRATPWELVHPYDHKP